MAKRTNSGLANVPKGERNDTNIIVAPARIASFCVGNAVAAEFTEESPSKWTLSVRPGTLRPDFRPERLSAV